jgi:hypothetical protein
MKVIETAKIIAARIRFFDPPTVEPALVLDIVDLLRCAPSVPAARRSH